MFDFNEVVQFKYDTAEYTLNLPWAILDNKLPNVRKLFKFMGDSNDTEHEAAKKTALMLFQYVAFAYDELKAAANTYADEYRDTKYIKDESKCTEAERKNKKLAAAVKKAEREHKKAVKLQQEFVDIYNKFNKQ